MPDVDSIRAHCNSLPDVTEDMPWADDLCFKIRGKIFATIVLSDGRFPRVTLKCSPEEFHRLLEIEGIAPAAYVGRYNWVALTNSNILPSHELEELIRQSYNQVASKAPRKKTTTAALQKKTMPKAPKKKTASKTRRKKFSIPKGRSSK